MKIRSFLILLILLLTASFIFINIEITGNEEKSIIIKGIVTAKGNAWIEVKENDKKKANRYYPFWHGGSKEEGGGFDKKMVENIKNLLVLNKVKLEYKFVKRFRIISVEMQATGVIVSNGDSWIKIKTKDGKSEKYMPRWTGGDSLLGGGYFDGTILNKILKLDIGDKVEFYWIYDDGRRITEIELETASFPLGLRGFSGRVRGLVVSKGDDDSFMFMIYEMLDVWKNNTSDEPWKVVPLTFRVRPDLKKVDGKLKKVESHVKFIKKLKEKEMIILEIYNPKGDVATMAIFKLSEEQQE